MTTDSAKPRYEKRGLLITSTSTFHNDDRDVMEPPTPAASLGFSAVRSPGCLGLLQCGQGMTSVAER